MKIKFKTKEELKKLKELELKLESNWHDYFCLWLTFFDGGFAWLSTVQRRKRLICESNYPEYRCNLENCASRWPSIHHTKSEFRFITTLTVKDR